MNLTQLVLAGLHARASGVPAEALVDDSRVGQWMTPAAALNKGE
jgi:hypothetical protein